MKALVLDEEYRYRAMTSSPPLGGPGMRIRSANSEPVVQADTNTVISPLPMRFINGTPKIGIFAEIDMPVFKLDPQMTGDGIFHPSARNPTEGRMALGNNRQDTRW